MSIRLICAASLIASAALLLAAGDGAINDSERAHDGHESAAPATNALRYLPAERATVEKQLAAQR